MSGARFSTGEAHQGLPEMATTQWKSTGRRQWAVGRALSTSCEPGPGGLARAPHLWGAIHTLYHDTALRSSDKEFVEYLVNVGMIDPDNIIMLDGEGMSLYNFQVKPKTTYTFDWSSTKSLNKF